MSSLTNVLLHRLLSLLILLADNDIVAQVHAELLQGLRSRYSEIFEWNSDDNFTKMKPYYLATATDPRSKGMQYGDPQLAANVETLLLDEIRSKMVDADPAPANRRRPVDRARDPIYADIAAFVGGVHRPPLHSPEMLLADFRAVEHPEICKNPAEWWRQYKDKFKPIFEVYVDYACIPLSLHPSVPV